jgi:hypothetical protein
MATTWNPSDEDAGVALSGGDLIATVAGAWASVRATLAKTSGKHYFEVTLDTLLYVRVGVATSATPLNQPIGAETTGWAYDTFSGQKYNSSTGSYGVACAQGDVVMVAVDIDAGKIWVGKNGTWFDSGDPVAGTNPMYTDAGITNVFPATSGYTSAVTANFGGSAFSYTPPSGFNAGWEIENSDITGTLAIPSLELSGLLTNPYRFMNSSLMLPQAIISGELSNPSRWITGALSLPLLQISAAMQKSPDIVGTVLLPLLRSYATLNAMVYVSSTLEKDAIPALTVVAEGSGYFSESIFALTSTASATQHPIAKLTKNIPSIELIATALQKHVGTLLQGLPAITLSGEAHEDGLASLADTIPAIQLTANAIAGIIGTLEKSIGSISLSASGYFLGSNRAILTIPAIALDAEVRVSDATFIALALNTKNFGLSKYTSYGYNSLCTFNGKTIGAKSDGIYELSGTADKNGAVISWKLKTGKLLMHKARLREVLLFGKISGDVIMSVETAEGAKYEYDVEPVSEYENYVRVKVGKGLDSEYLIIELTNEFGETIQIDKIQGFGMKL